MKKHSNQTAYFVIIAIAVLSFFSCSSSSDGKTNMYASGTVGTKVSGTGEMYGGNLSSFKGRASTTNYGSNSGIAIPGAVSVPSASISQVDVENVPQRNVSGANVDAANAYHQSTTKGFKSAEIASLNTQANTPKADINATLKANIAVNEKGKVIKGKTVATVAADKKGPQKGGPAKPAEPGLNLPVGDGVWVLMIMLIGYVSICKFRIVGS
jgi:hypothetical protein